MISHKKKYSITFPLLILVFTNIMCDNVNNSSDSDLFEGTCRLDLNVKEEWSTDLNKPYIRFLVNAKNIGDLPIHTIEVTANLYFKNNDIIKSRFYINGLEILAGEEIEKYGLSSDSNSNRFFTSTLTQNDLDRIIYNAPYYTCLK